MMFYILITETLEKHIKKAFFILKLSVIEFNQPSGLQLPDVILNT